MALIYLMRAGVAREKKHHVISISKKLPQKWSKLHIMKKDRKNLRSKNYIFLRKKLDE